MQDLLQPNGLCEMILKSFVLKGRPVKAGGSHSHGEGEEASVGRVVSCNGDEGGNAAVGVGGEELPDHLLGLRLVGGGREHAHAVDHLWREGEGD